MTRHFEKRSTASPWSKLSETLKWRTPEIMDLTQRRLISANDKVVEQQTELDRVRVELAELRSVHEAMRGSAAFRIANKLWAMRNALRV